MSKRGVDKIAWIAIVGVWGFASGSLFTQHCYGSGTFIAMLTVASWLRLVLLERNDCKRLQMYKDLYEHFNKRYYEKVAYERSSRTK